MTTHAHQMLEFLQPYVRQFSTASLQKAQYLYDKLEDGVQQEFFIPASEAQVNQALTRFVVNNVKQLLDLHLELHNGWLRLYATVNYQGIFAKLAVNLGLVHVQLDRHRQRFVFNQLGDTEVLSLYTNSYLKTQAINTAIWGFHRVLKRDPLGLILGKINLVRQKEDVLYLDIGRWLKKSEKIMSTLNKVQVNHGLLVEKQLLLKANANIAEVLNLGGSQQLISEADNPNHQ
ncbi:MULTISPECIES: hypothetical protein [unclassified Moraxella]|uniref:hypothetical protein n=1 Tax=unclassified Moraxella TaxID=2685852 RepID=UPI003AF55A9E